MLGVLELGVLCFELGVLCFELGELLPFEEQLVLLQRLTTENIDLTDAGLSKDELEQLTGGGKKDAEAGPDRENTVNGAGTGDGKTTEG